MKTILTVLIVVAMLVFVGCSDDGKKAEVDGGVVEAGVVEASAAVEASVTDSVEVVDSSEEEMDAAVVVDAATD